MNCDSLQVYRGLDIGTAKTPPAERGGIPHHLMDFLAPDEIFNAGQYAAAARRVLQDISRRGRLPVVTGGTGFYLQALLHGLSEGPVRDAGMRARLQSRESRRPGASHRVLRRLDPATAARIHPNDVQKTIRALEICLLARRPASRLFAEADAFPLEGYRPLQIGLDPPRPFLHERIAVRTKAIFEAGLLDEVRNLLEHGVHPQAKAFESIGYKEALACLQGRITPQQAVELTTIATRQYAKRQLTWFRRDPDIRWIRLTGEQPEAAALAERWTREWLADFTPTA